MKVLIVGSNSYIGSHLKNRLQKETISVDEFDIENTDLDESILSVYDVVVHVAAIVHKKDITEYAVYQKVNTELPIKVALLAKAAGVKHFVFISTMGVYGKGRSIADPIIHSGEAMAPTEAYGKSKYEAEIALKKLEENSFTVSIVRPTSVYGKGCKGGLFDNYIKIAFALPIIPACEMDISQGMVYIDNLSEIITNIIKNRSSGVFHPQDSALISSSEMLHVIRLANNKKSCLSGFWGKMITRIFNNTGLYKKFFGGVYYSNELTDKEIKGCQLLSTRAALYKIFQED